jgi:hypothetical protein
MDLNASLRFDHQLLAIEHEHSVHCMLELTAPPAPDDADRPPSTSHSSWIGRAR